MTDFFVQQFPVALTHPIEGLIHSVFSHSEFLANLGLGRALRLVDKQFLQLFKQTRITSREVLVLQSCERLLQNSQRPAALENSVSAQPVGRLKIGAPAREQFFQRYKRLA